MNKNKYKKYHKKKNIYQIKKQELSVLKFGVYGLKVIEYGIITQKELETARRIIARMTSRCAKINLNSKCFHPLTKKSLLSRMGKGSGNIHLWIGYLKKGEIILEIKGVTEKIAYQALRAVCSRFSLKIIIVKREIFKA